MILEWESHACYFGLRFVSYYFYIDPTYLLKTSFPLTIYLRALFRHSPYTFLYAHHFHHIIPYPLIYPHFFLYLPSITVSCTLTIPLFLTSFLSPHSHLHRTLHALAFVCMHNFHHRLIIWSQDDTYTESYISTIGVDFVCKFKWGRGRKGREQERVQSERREVDLIFIQKIRTISLEDKIIKLQIVSFLVL